MTPSRFRAYRHTLGLTQQQMAETLGLKSARTIRRYETEGSHPPEWAAILIEHIAINTNRNKEKQHDLNHNA